jgi:hypothetical protein
VIPGPRTHVITAALALDRDTDDGTQLPELLDITARSRAIQEVLADKVYSDVENQEKIASIGALARSRRSARCRPWPCFLDKLDD